MENTNKPTGILDSLVAVSETIKEYKQETATTNQELQKLLNELKIITSEQKDFKEILARKVKQEISKLETEKKVIKNTIDEAYKETINKLTSNVIELQEKLSSIEEKVLNTETSIVEKFYEFFKVMDDKMEAYEKKTQEYQEIIHEINSGLDKNITEIHRATIFMNTQKKDMDEFLTKMDEFCKVQEKYCEIVNNNIKVVASEVEFNKTSRITNFLTEFGFEKFVTVCEKLIRKDSSLDKLIPYTTELEKQLNVLEVIFTFSDLSNPSEFIARYENKNNKTRLKTILENICDLRSQVSEVISNNTPN